MTAKDEIHALKKSYSMRSDNQESNEGYNQAIDDVLTILGNCIIIRKSDVDSGLKAAGLLNLNNIETKALIGELIAKAKDE